jgi:hypothetical protein
MKAVEMSNIKLTLNCTGFPVTQRIFLKGWNLREGGEGG